MPKYLQCWNFLYLQYRLFVVQVVKRPSWSWGLYCLAWFEIVTSSINFWYSGPYLIQILRKPISRSSRWQSHSICCGSHCSRVMCEDLWYVAYRRLNYCLGKFTGNVRELLNCQSVGLLFVVFNILLLPFFPFLSCSCLLDLLRSNRFVEVQYFCHAKYYVLWTSGQQMHCTALSVGLHCATVAGKPFLRICNYAVFNLATATNVPTAQPAVS